MRVVWSKWVSAPSLATSPSKRRALHPVPGGASPSIKPSARLARAEWFLAGCQSAPGLVAAHHALQAQDWPAARALLHRARAQGLPDESALARQLLASRAQQTSHGPTPSSRADSHIQGRVVFNGVELLGEIEQASGRAAPPIDIEIDGVFSRFLVADEQSSQAHAKPRKFRLELPPTARVIRVGVGGRQFEGSPCVRTRGVEAFPESPPCPRDDVPWILVPVYGAAHALQRCLNSVFQAECRLSFKILVVDDATPEPGLRQWLQALAGTGRITLLQRPLNGGFVAAVNTGLRYLGARDIVLLNSDTVVTQGWLDRLCLAAYASPQIGAVNPLSNNAELLSLPHPMEAGLMPDLTTQTRLNRLLQETASRQVVDAPAGVGFCWYLKGEALASIGLMDETVVEGGYGEDTDYSIRLQKAGWRLVVALDTYVAHEGSRSFGVSKQQLAFRNVPLLQRLHPEHEIDYQAFLSRNPLDSLNRQLQRAVFTGAEGPARGQSLWITHQARVLRRQRFTRDARWALIPVWEADALRALALVATDTVAVARVEYLWPGAASELMADLRAAGFSSLVFESFADWTPEALQFLGRLELPREARLADASAYCPRQHAHQGPVARCPEPKALAGCHACLATHGQLQRGSGDLAAWRKHTAALLREASVLAVPDAALVQRLHQRFGAVFPRQPATALTVRPQQSRTPKVQRIGFYGLTDHGAGYGVALALARKLHATQSKVRLIVVGVTLDDPRLAAFECVELPGDIPDATLAEAFTMLECDALADPAFARDGLMAELAANLHVPCLDRDDLLALAGRQPKRR